MASINFFNEDIEFDLKGKAKIRHWLKAAIKAEDYTLSELNYIFCSDAYLLKINQDFLKHNTYTDIVTFDNSDEEKRIAGDIFISIDRIRENALKFNVDFKNELHRVMIHGTLHLMGYKDKTKTEKSLMTQKEDTFLAMRI